MGCRFPGASGASEYWKLLCDGVDAVSTREIASAAQVAEGSIYRHFKSKEVLAEALFEAIHSRLFDLVETALEDAAGGIVRRLVDPGVLQRLGVRDAEVAGLVDDDDRT